MTTPVQERDHEGLLAGVAYAGGATLAVGSSVAVLGLLTDYPALGGQALRYGLAAVLLAAAATAGLGPTAPRAFPRARTDVRRGSRRSQARRRGQYSSRPPARG
jgi:hypothetical protein